MTTPLLGSPDGDPATSTTGGLPADLSAAAINKGHTIKINVCKRKDKSVRGFEVGRRYHKGRQLAGAFVHTWEEATALRADKERQLGEQQARQQAANQATPPPH